LCRPSFTLLLFYSLLCRPFLHSAAFLLPLVPTIPSLCCFSTPSCADHSFTLLLLYSIMHYSPLHTLISHFLIAATFLHPSTSHSLLCRPSFTLLLFYSAPFLTLHTSTSSLPLNVIRVSRDRYFSDFILNDTNRSLWRLLFSKKRGG
ncbi:MAG: hypothetical protein K0R47_4059, partial [Brevibacillus sp.]|nr:hypothetical protein [Brevibacillus sp.]